MNDPSYQTQRKRKRKPDKTADVQQKTSDIKTETKKSSRLTKQEQKSLSRRLGDRLPDDPTQNKDGYRYYLAEPDPNCPESENKELDYHGGIIPSKHYRRWWPNKVQLSSIDAAHQLVLDVEQQTVMGFHGYSTIRATHGILTGDYYYEIKILEMPKKEDDPSRLGQGDSAVRVGWSTEKHLLQTPSGYGPFSFSIRSRKGTIFHQAKGKHYTDTEIKEGDVLGCRMKLPEINARLFNEQVLRERFEASKNKHRKGANLYQGNMGSKRKKKNKEKTEFQVDKNEVCRFPMPNCMKSQNDGVLVTHKGFYYFEQPEPENLPKTAPCLPDDSGAEVEFFHNGKSLGIAFNKSIPYGEYFPTVSLYRSCKVQANFGPKFAHGKMKKGGPIKPMSTRAKEITVESALSDLLYTLDDRSVNQETQKSSS